MPEIQSFHRSIDKQIQANKGKNLYYFDRDALFKFSEGNNILSQRHKFGEILSDTAIQESLIEYTLSNVLREFFQTNQYITVNERDKSILRKIYKKLLSELSDQQISLSDIASRHFTRLTTWLSYSNPHIEKFNPSNQKTAVEVVCSEYSAELQLELLDLNPKNILEPILDIGCGEHAHLSAYLKEKELNVIGIDRLLNKKESWLYEISWFEYEFKPDSWGTIISNLSFTSHFLNNHLREDGFYLEYAQKYMEILQSLKQGGAYHYAPSLPFIEEHLDKKRYRVDRKNINTDHQRTIVTRL
ncbi:MAG: hypothetical protein J7604_18410 [Sporocytophaga sp.]|uniref:class I SAM-dependent methyltransferase n=1 Tax=Sporocytophaga sp. TaxID=2231183 RepID=UPI001B107356|nr:class I SAM-dependent methyltransferase [Sporocytophaga sp.]MBO9702189.1 hypothetical protein [Sporocytophaga sp.]